MPRQDLEYGPVFDRIRDINVELAEKITTLGIRVERAQNQIDHSNAKIQDLSELKRDFQRLHGSAVSFENDINNLVFRMREVESKQRQYDFNQKCEVTSEEEQNIKEQAETGFKLKLLFASIGALLSGVGALAFWLITKFIDIAIDNLRG